MVETIVNGKRSRSGVLISGTSHEDATEIDTNVDNIYPPSGTLTVHGDQTIQPTKKLKLDKLQSNTSTNTISVPNVVTDAIIVTTEGNQTINGVKTFTNSVHVSPNLDHINLTDVTNQIRFKYPGDGGLIPPHTTYITAQTPPLGGDFTFTVPSVSNSKFLMTENAGSLDDINGNRKFTGHVEVSQLKLPGVGVGRSVIIDNHTDYAVDKQFVLPNIPDPTLFAGIECSDLDQIITANKTYRGLNIQDFGSLSFKSGTDLNVDSGANLKINSGGFLKTNTITSNGDTDIAIDATGAGKIKFNTVSNNGAIFSGDGTTVNWALKTTNNIALPSAPSTVIGTINNSASEPVASVGANNTNATAWLPIYIQPVNISVVPESNIVFGNPSLATVSASGAKLYNQGKILTTDSMIIEKGDAQIIFGATANKMNFNVAEPLATRELTIQDPGENAEFAFLQGAQTFSGVKTFPSGKLQFSSVSGGETPIALDSTFVGTTPITIPRPLGGATLLLSAGLDDMYLNGHYLQNGDIVNANKGIFGADLAGVNRHILGYTTKPLGVYEHKFQNKNGIVAHLDDFNGVYGNNFTDDIIPVFTIGAVTPYQGSRFMPIKHSGTSRTVDFSIDLIGTCAGTVADDCTLILQLEYFKSNTAYFITTATFFPITTVIAGTGQESNYKINATTSVVLLPGEIIGIKVSRDSGSAQFDLTQVHVDYR